MSDDLKKAFEEMKADLRGVKHELQATREAFRTALTAVLTAVDERMSATEERFDTFLVRVNEVSEMLITHDTEQLKRVIAVENENAALRQQWQDISRRVEALEKKAG